jgi:hypothetical protein
MPVYYLTLEGRAFAKIVNLCLITLMDLLEESFVGIQVFLEVFFRIIGFPLVFRLLDIFSKSFLLEVPD